MRKIHYLFYFIVSLCLVGCVTPGPEQLMSPIHYKGKVNFHVAKNAYLYWQSGTQFSETENMSYYGGDPLAAIIGSAIEEHQRKTHPSRYTYVYGSAQQAVFMTSLKNALIKNNVFNQVEIITAPKSIGPNDVMITVKFRSTRISSYEQNAITLTVDMSIQTKNEKYFKRTYVIHNTEPEGRFAGRSFKEQQTEVSQKLLSKLINGLEQWHS